MNESNPLSQSWLSGAITMHASSSAAARRRRTCVNRAACSSAGKRKSFTSPSRRTVLRIRFAAHPPSERPSQPVGVSTWSTVTPSLRRYGTAQPGRIDGHGQGLRKIRHTPHMGPMTRPDELEDPFGQLDSGVDFAVLARSRGRSRPARSRVPHSTSNVTGTGDPYARRHASVGIVEQHAVGFVADAPLTKRHIAHMVRPHLRRLDLQALPQTRCRRALRRRGTARPRRTSPAQ